MQMDASNHDIFSVASILQKNLSEGVLLLVRFLTVCTLMYIRTYIFPLEACRTWFMCVVCMCCVST